MRGANSGINGQGLAVRAKRRRWLTGLAALAVLSACSGDTDGTNNPIAGAGPMSGGSGSLPPGSAPGGGNAGAGAPGTAGQPPGGANAGAPAPGSCGRQIEPARAVLLTPLQYAHALRDLLGPTALTDDA